MIEVNLIIKNKLGLHARPAALFTKTANKFSAEIVVEKDDEQVNGKSIMGLMMLAAGNGSQIKVTADGNDEKEAINAIEELINSNFKEE